VSEIKREDLSLGQVGTMATSVIVPDFHFSEYFALWPAVVHCQNERNKILRLLYSIQMM